MAIVCLFSTNVYADDSDVTVVVDADFTTITTGTPEEPVIFPSYGTGSFTSYFTGWQVSKVYQAGGQILIADQGYLRTNYVNLSANGGTVKITTKVKAMDNYGGMVKFQIGYSSSNTATVYLADNEWHDVSVIIAGGTSYTYVRVEPYLSASGLLLQNLKVEQSASFIAAPTANQPAAATATSFTASWSKVTGATAYYLDVYYYNGNEKVYFIKNEEVSGTSREVTGLDANHTYYYVVRATNGTGVSEDSNEIEVVEYLSEIATPQNVAIKKGSSSFTATWDAVNHATSYFVEVNKYTTLKEEANVDVLYDDFSGVKVGTLESIEYIYNTDPYTAQSGWEGTALGAAVGHMVLSPWGSDCYLITPELNLSDSNGVFIAKYTLAEGAFGYYYADGTATLSLIDSEDTELESQTITFEQGFKTYTLSFTKGTANCRLKLSYSGSRKVFIDEIAVSQLKPAGTVLSETYKAEEVTDTTYNCTCEVLSDVVYGFKVSAIGRTVTSGEIVNIYSAPSSEEKISFSSSVVSAGADNFSIVANGSDIIVKAANSGIINVYDASGRHIYQGFYTEGETRHNIGVNGMVIVVANGKSIKIILK